MGTHPPSRQRTDVTTYGDRPTHWKALLMFRIPVRATLIVAPLLVVPAAASGATVTLGAACYLQAAGASQPIPVTVAGLGAGQSVTVKLSRKGEVAGSAFGTADAAGSLPITIGTWFTKLGTGPKKEVAAQVDAFDAAGAVVGTAPVSLANAGLDVTGKRGLRTWRVQGLTALTGQNTYYAHYLNHGKYKGRLKLGTAKGNCGYLKAKKPLTPFKKLGRYDVFVTTSKQYDPAAPNIPGRVVVTRTFR